LAGLSDFISELKRRRVIRALLGWGLVGFAVLQVIEPLMHALELPDWTLKLVVALLAAGFPVTAGLAWVFDLRSTGIERTPPTEPAPGAPAPSRARLALLLAGLGAAAAVPGVAYLALRRPAPERADAAPGERIPIAVADFENDTGEPELDALSGLLITSLEQSRRLDVLTRSRMVDILRQLGHVSTPRIDEPLGREVGRRAAVRALVVAAIHRFDALYTIELKALDPATSSYLFTLKADGKGKASIPGLIDQLSEQTRERLRERPAEVASSRVQVGEAITSSLEAYQHYFQAKALQSGRGDYLAAIQELQRAVAIDPGFALANYEIAYLGTWTDLPEAERRAALEAALRKVDRVPGKERDLMLAWKAHQDGRDDEADALYIRAVRTWPNDKLLQFHAGDLRYHAFLSPRGSTRDLDDVLPFFAAAVALDPTEGETQAHLVGCLTFLGRDAEAVAAARAWVAASPVPRASSALGGALAAAGRWEEAERAYRQAIDAGIAPFMLTGYLRGLARQGRFDAFERLAPGAAGLSPMDRVTLSQVRVELALLQGRYREALEALRDVPDRLSLEERTGIPARVRAAVEAARGDPAAAWRAAAPLLEPGGGVDLVPVQLALAGDAAHAAAAAQHLVPGSRQLAFHEAVAAWRAGRVEDGAARLEALSRSKYAADAALASALLGELEAERGRDALALQALERYRAAGAPPTTGADAALRLPRVLFLLARSYQRSGDRARARERLDQLLGWWAHADPGLPLLSQARALDGQLRAYQGAGR
jgi:tetratricopeptide (TPR) repeat protein